MAIARGGSIVKELAANTVANVTLGDAIEWEGHPARRQHDTIAACAELESSCGNG